MNRRKLVVRCGKIIENGVVQEPHEVMTTDFFRNLGKDIELLPPSNTPRNKTADFRMDGLDWESKSPEVPKAKSIEKLFHKAAKQSQNVIMDLRRLPDDVGARKTLDKCFRTSSRVRNLYIITQQGVLVAYKK